VVFARSGEAPGWAPAGEGETQADGTRLLVRPVPPEGWAALGATDAEADERSERARRALEPFRVHRISPIDVHVVQVPNGHGAPEFVRGLRETGLYEFIEPDALLHPIGTVPNDPKYGFQWHLPWIGCERAWDKVVGESDVVVAVVDTGVDLTHLDLVSRLVSGYNSVDRRTQADGGDVSDVNGHGTAVGGTAAAHGNNGLGVAAVGWRFGLMPVRCSNAPGGSAWLSDIIDGVAWAAQNGARVVNVSYTGAENAVAESMGAWMREHGSLLVWGADNFGTNYDWFDHPSVLIVAGTDAGDALAPGSAFGRAIDLVAPSTDIFTTRRGGGYGAKTGNSYAAPIVAGTCALIWSADPSLTPAQVEQVLLSTCVDLGDPGDDDIFGRGRVDAGAAIAAVIPDEPRLVSSGRTLIPPDDPGDRTAPGLAVTYYDVGGATSLPDFSALTPIGLSIEPVIDFPATLGEFARSGRADRVGAVCTGYYLAPTDGAYTFWLESSDGSRLFVSDRLVVDHDGLHDPSEAWGTVSLRAGPHALRIEYFEATGAAALVARVQPPGEAKDVIPGERLIWVPARTDFNRDGYVNMLDVVEFLNAFTAGDSAADFNADGSVNSIDVLNFLEAFFEDL